MQARITTPFTSISQAPQLPVRQAVGMVCRQRRAASSQGSPALAWSRRPSGHWIGIADSAIAAQQGFKVNVALKIVGQSLQQPMPLVGVVLLQFRQGLQAPTTA